MRTALILAAILTLAGCAAPTAQADPCDDATTLATQAYDDAEQALNDSRAVRPQPVDSDLSRTPREDQIISDYTSAKIDAERSADHRRDKLKDDARRYILRWATIIEQNDECFDVQQRADAAELLRAVG